MPLGIRNLSAWSRRKLFQSIRIFVIKCHSSTGDEAVRSVSESIPPYSLKYLRHIAGASYAYYVPLDDSEYGTNRDAEFYNAMTLWTESGGSWEDTIRPFRSAFLNAGFIESYDSENDMFMYVRSREFEFFFIWGEHTLDTLDLNQSGVVVIQHLTYIPSE